MKVSELLKTRQANWQELEQLCTRMEGRSPRKIPAASIDRFASLYRAACADLALADAYQIPPATVHYLHRLVGRSHNQLYRTRPFNIRQWRHDLFVRVPRQLFTDNCLRLAFAVFWGVFLLSAMLAYSSPGYADRVMGRDMMEQMEENFSEPVSAKNDGLIGGMTGFYIFNNTSIGLRCFAFGLLFGVGGLYITVFNAAFLGAAFGHMATVQEPQHFFEFVTAHGPFELTAIVVSAGVGMRLGFSLVDTKGFKRIASLRRAANEAMPAMGAAMVMFFFAALIEGFISPSPLPYEIKAAVGVLSAGFLMFYFVVLGYPSE